MFYDQRFDSFCYGTAEMLVTMTHQDLVMISPTEKEK